MIGSQGTQCMVEPWAVASGRYSWPEPCGEHWVAVNGQTLNCLLHHPATWLTPLGRDMGHWPVLKCRHSLTSLSIKPVLHCISPAASTLWRVFGIVCASTCISQKVIECQCLAGLWLFLLFFLTTYKYRPSLAGMTLYPFTTHKRARQQVCARNVALSIGLHTIIMYIHSSSHTSVLPRKVHCLTVQQSPCARGSSSHVIIRPKSCAAVASHGGQKSRVGKETS